MPFNILLLPLLGGFIFISKWNCTRWYAVRAEKERLILYAAIAGLIWLAIAYCLKLFIAPIFPCQPGGLCIPVWFRENIPFDYGGISSAAFVLAATMWLPLNAPRWLKRFPKIFRRDEQFLRVVKSQGTALEQMVTRALLTKKYLLISLKGGKVYVGRVVSAFEPAARDASMVLFPTLSGYRASDNRMVCWTLNYDQTYFAIGQEHDDEEMIKQLLQEFRLVLPVTEITSVTAFSYDMYNKHFSDSSEYVSGPQSL